MNKSKVFQYSKWTLVAVLAVTGYFDAMALVLAFIASTCMVNDFTATQTAQ